jgi:hypothetical protein
MTTYREAIYMCLDLLKGTSDDFSYTEDHIAYLLDKFRALLLKQAYGTDPKKHIPYTNYQTIEVTFTPKEVKDIIKSDNQVPNMLQLGIPRIITPDNYYYDYKFEFTSRERLPFTGNNRFTSMINYCALDEDNYVLYKTKPNQWVMAEDAIQLTPDRFSIVGIFENPKDLYDDYMDEIIPIEETLVTTLVGMVFDSLVKVVTLPSDTINNGTDENASMPTTMQKGKNS